MKRLAIAMLLTWTLLTARQAHAGWLDTRFNGPGANGTINFLADFKDELFAIGFFTQMNGIPANNVARWNGTNWTGFRPTDPNVHNAVTVGDQLIARILEPPPLASNLQAWDGSKWTPLGLPAGFSYVNEFLADGNSLLAEVAETVSTNNGFPVSKYALARWAQGNWSMVAPLIQGGASYAVAQNQVFLAGIGVFGDLQQFDIARLDGGQCVALPLANGLKFNWSWALTSDGTNLFVAGWLGRTNDYGYPPDFALFDGVDWRVFPPETRDGFSVLPLYSGQGFVLAQEVQCTPGTVQITAGRIVEYRGANRTVIAPCDAPVIAARRWRGEIYVIAGPIGDFRTGGIARWDGTKWNRLGDGDFQGLDYEASVIASSGTNLYAAGPFSFAGLGRANRIARFDGSTWHPLGAGINGGIDPRNEFSSDESVRQMAVWNNELFVIGSFIIAGVTTNIARWNGDWLPVGDRPQGSFFALTATDSGLYLARAFQTNLFVSRWDGATWTDIATGTIPYYSDIHALCVHGDKITIGGTFTNINGIPANNIATWSAGEWQTLAKGVRLDVPSVPGSSYTPAVFALLPDGDTLIAGGAFLQAGDVPAHHVARWDGANWSAMGEIAGDYGCAWGQCAVPVRALVEVDGKILAGGSGFLSQWDGVAWRQLMDGPFLRLYDRGPYTRSLQIRTLAPYSNAVFFGGNFFQIGDTGSFGIGLWHTEQALQLESQQDSLLLSWPDQFKTVHIEAADSVTGTWQPITSATATTSAPNRTAAKISRPESTRFIRLNSGPAN